MRYIITLAVSTIPMQALADVPRVITDLPPVYGLAAQVMGDLGQPVLLLDKGADAHDFQLRPSQMRDLAAADIAVWIGPEMTPWLDRALQGGKADMLSLALLDLPGTQILRGAEGAPDEHAHEDEHHKDEAHKDEAHKDEAHKDEAHKDEAHKDEGHAHIGVDPHAWLTPQNAAPWLDAIAAALSQKDAANAATYAANAAAAKAEIAALDAELAAALAPVKDKGFAAYHDAYQYFTAHYGLSFKGAVAMGDATTAGAAHLRKMQEIIAHDVVCVFPEAQHDAQALLQLVAGTSAKPGAPLDPEGANLDPSRSSYADVLRNMTKALTDCLANP